MSRILFFFQQLISGPASLFSGPFSFFRDVYSRSNRSKAFILALPALFLVFFGGALLLASQLGRESRLITKYDELAKKASQQVETLMPNYSKAERLYQLERMKLNEPGDAGATGAAGAASADIGMENSLDGPGQKPTDPELMSETEKKFRKYYSEILELRNAEKLYLQKLIDLAPNDSSYKFRYAMAHAPFEPRVVVDLISAMAPIDENGTTSKVIGNPEAHLWMAWHYFRKPAKTKRDAQLAAVLIEKHASRCLIVDSTNQQARELRGHVLQMTGEFSRAYDDFSVLFESEPRYFVRLVQLNKQMDRKSRNTEVLDLAARRLQQQLGSSRENVAKWESNWELYSNCMMQRQRFTTLKQELQLERDAFADDELKRNFLNSILGNAFSSRVSELMATVATNPVDADEAIQILETAANSEVLNDVLKYLCVSLAKNVPSLAARAKAVYDFEKDPDPSALVLGEIAINALQNQEYARAITVLERARAKTPDNSVILNNLAFAYLSAETSSPARALDLVDQAIRSLDASQMGNEEFSRFQHTRGVALMQLNRIDEAKGAFLQALKGRPDNESILEALIRCEEGRDEIQRQVYLNKLKSIREKSNPVGDGQ